MSWSLPSPASAKNIILIGTFCTHFPEKHFLSHPQHWKRPVVLKMLFTPASSLDFRIVLSLHCTCHDLRTDYGSNFASDPEKHTKPLLYLPFWSILKTSLQELMKYFHPFPQPGVAQLQCSAHFFLFLVNYYWLLWANNTINTASSCCDRWTSYSGNWTPPTHRPNAPLLPCMSRSLRWLQEIFLFFWPCLSDRRRLSCIHWPLAAAANKMRDSMFSHKLPP